MTYQEALNFIDENTRKGDSVGTTFEIICRNRGSHPVRDWAIYDLAIAKSMDRESAKTTYNRHLKRLYEIFVFRSPTIYGGT